MVIDVVGSQHRPRKLLQQVVLFISGAVGADHANGVAAFGIQNPTQALACVLNRLFPGCGSQLAVATDQGLADAVFVVEKVKSVTALDAEKVAIHPALVAVVAAYNVHAGIGAAHAQGGLAAVATMSADGAHVLHLPGTGLVTIGPRGQSAQGADINAHAAFLAVQVVAFVGSNHRAGAPVLYAQRPYVHAFAADANATVT